MSSRVESYERRSSMPMTALAFAFIVVYAIPIIWPHAPHQLAVACRTGNGALWLLFAADLVIRVRLADRRWRYLASHPVDVLVVALPMLRPLRLLRVFAAAQVLVGRGVRFSWLQTVQAVTVAVSVLMAVSALAVLDAERGAPDANIKTFGDALWWAGTTVTTVGYGDRFPVTGTGRLIAVALMLVGISLLGVVTATVAAWFITATSEVVEQDTLAIEARLAAVEARLVTLTDVLTDARR